MLDGKLQSIQRGTRMCVPKLVAIDAKVIISLVVMVISGYFCQSTKCKSHC